VEREIQQHKRIISALKRLSGCRVVPRRETVVTVYDLRAERKRASCEATPSPTQQCKQPATRFAHDGGHSDAS